MSISRFPRNKLYLQTVFINKTRDIDIICIDLDLNKVTMENAKLFPIVTLIYQRA